MDCKFGTFELPGLILHIKAFTITKLDRKQKSESIDLTLVYIAFPLLGWKQVLSVNDVKQCCSVGGLFFCCLLSLVWNRPMPLCGKTSRMLSTSRVYTYFMVKLIGLRSVRHRQMTGDPTCFFSYSSGGLPWLLSLFSKRNAFVWQGGVTENGENTGPNDLSIERRTCMDIYIYR